MAGPLQRGRFGTRNLQMITIIQIGGLPAKRANWDSKFVNNNDHPNWRAPCKEGGLGQQIWRLPHRRRFGIPNLQTIMIFHIWPAPCNLCKVILIIWMSRPFSMGMMMFMIIILIIFLTVDWVSWCAAHCNIIVIMILGVTGSHSSLCQRPHGPRPPLSRDSTPSGLSSFWTSYRPTFCIIGYLDMGQVMAQGALASSGGTFDKSSLYVSWQDNGN